MRWRPSLPTKETACAKDQLDTEFPSSEGEEDLQQPRLEEAEARSQWPDFHPPAPALWGTAD